MESSTILFQTTYLIYTIEIEIFDLTWASNILFINYIVNINEIDYIPHEYHGSLLFLFLFYYFDRVEMFRLHYVTKYLPYWKGECSPNEIDIEIN